MALLHLENVFYAYEKTGTPVLRGVTADFEAGRMYALIGRSGAGKTTLLSLMSGLDVCTGGAISYKGEDLKGMDRDRYRASRAGVIFQSFNLLPGAAAVENVVLAMDLSGKKAQTKKRRLTRFCKGSASTGRPRTEKY